MAAPMRMLSVSRQLVLCVNKTVSQTAVVTPTTIQVRHKKRGHTKTKAPPKDTQKDKWTFRKKKNVDKPDSESQVAKYLGEKPEDDVWMHKWYPPQKMSLLQAIQNHREYAVPEMLDNEEGVVYAQFDLDMSTEKPSKFMKEVTATLLLPHTFQEGYEKKVIAVCKTEEEAKMALEKGAAFAGGTQIIRDLKNGEIVSEDFDFIVCTLEMMPEVTTIRKILGARLPSIKAGTCGVDLMGMLDIYVNGFTYQSSKISNKHGIVKCPVGKLNMPTEHLLTNFETYVHHITSQRKLTLARLGDFITGATMLCPPSPEQFIIEDEWFVVKKKEEEKSKEEGDAAKPIVHVVGQQQQSPQPTATNS